MKFERGFKSECERIALEIRGELRLEPIDRLDPLRLAAHLAIPVFALGKLKQQCGDDEAVARFHVEDRSALSAFTIFIGRMRVIFYNERNASTRRAMDLCHEVSHCVLEHEPGPVMNEQGSRLWNPQIEREADHLAGAILIPRDGAFELRRQGYSVEEIADHFGVSKALSRMRVGTTGVDLHVSRITRKFGR